MAQRKKQLQKPQSAAERALRERTFELYRDLGRSRSLTRLRFQLPRDLAHLTIAMLTKWSKEDGWVNRARQFDKDVEGLMPATADLDPNFDQVDHLLKAAHLVLMRALAASAKVVPTKPGEIKQLIDAGNNAIRLVEILSERRKNDRGADEQGNKAAMFAALDEQERRIREVLQAQDNLKRENTRLHEALKNAGIDLEEPTVIDGDAVEVMPPPALIERDVSSIEVETSVTSDPRPMTLAEKLRMRSPQFAAKSP